MDVKKIFNFYYDLCCQKLTVYQGTQAFEIKDTIREILNIPKDAEVEYLDDEGIPMVISSNLPNGIKIYVKLKKKFSDNFEKVTKDSLLPSISWYWLETKHKKKNNNLTVYQNSNDQTASCKGSLIMDNGEYFYTMVFEPLQCCVFASICPNNIEISEVDIDWMDFWRCWPEYPDPHNNFPGPIIEAGFYVNMNKKFA